MSPLNYIATLRQPLKKIRATVQCNTVYIQGKFKFKECACPYFVTWLIKAVLNT